MPPYMGTDVVRDRDTESGRYTPSVTDDEIIEFVEELDGAGTGEVAEEFDYRQPSAYRRLKALEEDGRIRSRRIGGSMFWRVVEEELE